MNPIDNITKDIKIQTLKNWFSTFARKRFNKDYATSNLGFRKRTSKRAKTSSEIVVKTGQTKKQFLSTAKYDSNGDLSFTVPNYTRAKRWYLFETTKEISDELKRILQYLLKVTKLRGSALDRVANGILKKRLEQRKMFTVPKSVYEELSTITDKEIQNSVNQIKQIGE